MLRKYLRNICGIFVKVCFKYFLKYLWDGWPVWPEIFGKKQFCLVNKRTNNAPNIASKMYVNNCKGGCLAKVCFKRVCWLQRMSYKPTHKEKTLPSYPIEKSNVVHDALLFHPPPLFSATVTLPKHSRIHLWSTWAPHRRKTAITTHYDLKLISYRYRLAIVGTTRWVSVSHFYFMELDCKTENKTDRCYYNVIGAAQCCIRVFNLGGRMFQLQILLKKNDL